MSEVWIVAGQYGEYVKGVYASEEVARSHAKPDENVWSEQVVGEPAEAKAEAKAKAEPTEPPGDTVQRTALQVYEALAGDEVDLYARWNDEWVLVWGAELEGEGVVLHASASVNDLEWYVPASTILEVKP